MALVSYPDSEGSDDEKPQSTTKPTAPAQSTTISTSTGFAVDKSNPRKIKVNLQETKEDTATKLDENEGPAPKRQRVGAGAFSGFNSMLPAPKNAANKKSDAAVPKGQPRKIFSLKTGTERGFDREADAELRQLFAAQDTPSRDGQSNGTYGTHDGPPDSEPASTSTGLSNLTSTTPKTGNAMMFKPLSVARKPQKKKKPPTVSPTEPSQALRPLPKTAVEELPQPTPKISLFSTGSGSYGNTLPKTPTATYQPLVYDTSIEETDEAGTDHHDGDDQTFSQSKSTPQPSTDPPTEPQSLDTIASDLNLSAAARRQLFGRKSGSSANAINVINFNTDQEYAANEVLRASGEQVQHNPVRAPSSGKHSLKQLVNMASDQKDALEDSFAAGRQNKREAGSKYGW